MRTMLEIIGEKENHEKRDVSEPEMTNQTMFFVLTSLVSSAGAGAAGVLLVCTWYQCLVAVVERGM